MRLRNFILGDEIWRSRKLCRFELSRSVLSRKLGNVIRCMYVCLLIRPLHGLTNFELRGVDRFGFGSEVSKATFCRVFFSASVLVIILGLHLVNLPKNCLDTRLSCWWKSKQPVAKRIEGIIVFESNFYWALVGLEVLAWNLERLR